MCIRDSRGTIPANPEGVPEYASDSQRRSKLYTGHYRPGNSQSSGCYLPLGMSQGCPVICNEAMRQIDVLLKAETKPVLLWIYND